MNRVETNMPEPAPQPKRAPKHLGRTSPTRVGFHRTAAGNTKPHPIQTKAKRRRANKTASKARAANRGR